MPRCHRVPGLDILRPGGATRLGRTALAPALVLLMAMGAAGSSASQGTGPKNLEAGLTRAVLAIRKSFVSGSPQPMLPMIPHASKVFLSVEAIAGDRGFYSRDQVQALLEKSFSSHPTVEFQVRLDRIRGAEEGAQVTICPATWTYLKGGKTTKVKLRFVLSRGSGSWILEEIREIH